MRYAHLTWLTVHPDPISMPTPNHTFSAGMTSDIPVETLVMARVAPHHAQMNHSEEKSE